VNCPKCYLTHSYNVKGKESKEKKNSIQEKLKTIENTPDIKYKYKQPL